MKIIRDGVCFELTPEELRDAYCEQEHIYDTDYVRMELEAIISADVDEESYVAAAKRVLLDSTLLDECAYGLRRNIDKYDMSWGYAVTEAVKDAVCQEQANVEG